MVQASKTNALLRFQKTLYQHPSYAPYFYPDPPRGDGEVGMLAVMVGREALWGGSERSYLRESIQVTSIRPMRSSTFAPLPSRRSTPFRQLLLRRYIHSQAFPTISFRREFFWMIERLSSRDLRNGQHDDYSPLGRPLQHRTEQDNSSSLSSCHQLAKRYTKEEGAEAGVAPMDKCASVDWALAWFFGWLRPFDADGGLVAILFFLTSPDLWFVFSLLLWRCDVMCEILFILHSWFSDAVLDLLTRVAFWGCHGLWLWSLVFAGYYNDAISRLS
jgi:hypothetical protein